ncbi:MAG TPA: 4-(cytidine 5'-diphospho)-2-C-methyl-D-erythritol kinase [Bryobacteraceae bacterium]|nr:4-(cytidine 5'-diphospho)-2-C-methyl-D-erythritol kinase [Bryobacteraceae bacterium]
MMLGPRRARLNALAKINLGLQVLGRRPDGFHELRTIFHTISLADTIEIEFTPGRGSAVSLECSVPIPGENLLERAARSVMDAARIRGEVRFRLTKAIPMGAGLGGGSSDAAAVLLALPVLAGRHLALARLIELGSALGSDVPFFLLGGAAVGVGRGTELYPLPDVPTRHALVVAPGVHVSTAEAYEKLARPELTSGAAMNTISSFESLAWMLSQDPAQTLPVVENDFETVVFRDFPKLGKIKRKLARQGANPALMSGSGSSLFGLFESRAAAARARRSLEGAVFAVTLISRARYHSMWWRRLATHIAGKTWPPQSRYA